MLNATIIAPLARIGLRYVAGGLLALGFTEATAGTISGEAAVGAAVLIASEGWYLLAKRMGWRT